MSQVCNNPFPVGVETNRRAFSRGLASIIAVRAVVVIIAVLAVIKGIELRNWAWAHSAPVRFNGDIGNGFNWGSYVVRNAAKFETAPPVANHPVPWIPFFRGFWSSYDAVEQSALRSDPHNYGLDYTPLRLLVMSLWTRDVRATNPTAPYWTPEFTSPLLMFNTVCELASAVAVFFLVWHWRGRSPRLAWVLGLSAALLVWFDPSVILDDHMWPQWDVWLLPFYLWAAFYCSTNRWFTAGVLLAIGAMLKGQVMMIAPLFALWALFDMKPWYLLRLVCGFATGAAIVVAPWLVNNATSGWWIASVGSAVALMTIPFLRRKFDAVATLACAFAVVLVVWPFVDLHWRADLPVWLLAIAAIVTPFVAPKKWIGVYVLSILAAAVFIAGAKLDGSWAWYHIGFKYPMDHFRTPAAGTVNNVPAIFGVRYGWRLYDPMTSVVLPWSGREFVVTFQLAMRLVYFAMLTLCAIGLTFQARRKSPATLIAFAAPWVLMFAFTPQMHCRYLVWGAVATSLCVGVSVGMTLLHVVVSALSAGMLLETMLAVNPDTAPKLLRVLQGMEPDLGWVVAIVALIYLYMLLKPGVRGEQPVALVTEDEGPESIGMHARATGARAIAN